MRVEKSHSHSFIFTFSLTAQVLTHANVLPLLLMIGLWVISISDLLIWSMFKFISVLALLNSLKARLAAAREDWRRETAQSTKKEIDRALSTAREAWAANHEDELEGQASQLEKSVREKLQAKHEEEKRKLVDDARREAETKFNNEKMKLEEELKKKVC